MKEPVYSDRIKKLAELAGKCDTVADIGTDHALLPILMLMGGNANKAIACDIKKGPLARAAENVKVYGTDSGKIDLRLGNGLDPLSESECDLIVIAGMGGLNIAEILENGKNKLTPDCRLLLQPNTCKSELRTYLAAGGFEITDESSMRDGEHTYLFIEARYTKAKPRKIDFIEAELGQYLRNKPEDRKIYFAYLKEKYEKKLEGLNKAAGDVKEEKKKAETILKEIQKYETP